MKVIYVSLSLPCKIVISSILLIILPYTVVGIGLIPIRLDYSVLHFEIENKTSSFVLVLVDKSIIISYRANESASILAELYCVKGGAPIIIESVSNSQLNNRAAIVSEISSYLTKSSNTSTYFLRAFTVTLAAAIIFITQQKMKPENAQSLPAYVHYLYSSTFLIDKHHSGNSVREDVGSMLDRMTVIHQTTLGIAFLNPTSMPHNTP
uniref:Uncharacterized protein n=1 Tax=Spongospora subterranea TaxID=70186 RepID=A0A0H5QLH7_9EUKA|eukprot:CRZ03000.1 hypothetical protein [Spongospora subterranea]